MKWQLLHQACFAGDAAEVERLLDAGANPNQVAPTNWRQTPLGRTLEFRITAPKHAGHVDVVRCLLRHGANPAVRSTHLDLTPYELACICGLEAAAALLGPAQAAAPPHPTGMTGLWYRAASRLPEEQCLDHLEPLLRSSPEVNVLWRNTSPLTMATGHAAHFRVADLLLAHGADPNAGISILHSSCEFHFQHLVPALRYLARQGWRVSACDATGQTALHKAAFLGYSAAARALLDLGADAAARDTHGATPLDLARRFRKAAVVKLLTAAG